jgi:hypothetical protein
MVCKLLILRYSKAPDSREKLVLLRRRVGADGHVIEKESKSAVNITDFRKGISALTGSTRRYAQKSLCRPSLRELS